MTDANEMEIFATLVERARESRPEDGRTHPCVAACVVKDGLILDYAFRGETGPGDHAEFGLLEKKLGKELLDGSTIYTTLEPCTTRAHPKVPCAKRLAEHKVARVVIGMLDPNPAVLGKGVKLLRDANIEVATFPAEYAAKIEALNRDFIRSFDVPPLELNTQRLALGDKVARYLPSRIYPATMNSSRDFNEDLMEDLRASATYVFRGGTGRYVPVRLRQLTNLPTRINVGLIDPTDPKVVTQRALDRLSQRGRNRSAIDDMCREIVEQIQICVVGLFDFRHSCEIEISFGQNTSAIRYEIFDSAAYVSLYHSSEEAFRYPETLRFERGSVFYRSFRFDCERHAGMCRENVLFNSRSSEETLVEGFTKLKLDASPSRISDLHNKFLELHV